MNNDFFKDNSFFFDPWRAMDEIRPNPRQRPKFDGQLNIDDLVPGLCFVRRFGHQVPHEGAPVYEVIGLFIDNGKMKLRTKRLSGLSRGTIDTQYLTDLGVMPYIGDAGVPNWNATNWIQKVDNFLPPVQLPDITTRRWYFDYPEDTEAPIISSNLYGDTDRNPRYRLTEVIVETLPKGKGGNYNVELTGRNIQSHQLNQIYNDAFKEKVEAEFIKRYGRIWG